MTTTTRIAASALAAAFLTACGATPPAGDRSVDERWLEYSEGRSYLRVPEGTIGHSSEVRGRVGELIRCHPTTGLVDDQTVVLQLRLDADGVRLEAVHRDDESSGVADCVEETVQSWQIRDLPSGDELIIPLEFGLLDGR